MANLNMDLTGTNPNCKETNILVQVFKSGQRINFGTPVHADSIHIFYASGGLANQELILDTDYTIPDEYTDDDNCSRARLVDSSFDKRIVTGVLLNVVPPAEGVLKLSLSYQRLFPTHTTNAYIERETIAWTPELARSVVDDIQALKLRVTKLDDTGSLTNAKAVVLDIDTKCTNKDNIIKDEEQIVDVPKGKFTIQPKHGSFFYSTVRVRLKSNGAELVQGTDFIITGMDSARTKASEATDSVYQFIVITAPIVGTVLIDYHAYGGEPTIDQYRDLLGDVNNIIGYINNSNTVTESNLGGTSVITSMIERIHTLEDKMRRLDGTPSYGDITSGNATLMKIIGDGGDNQLHWYTIASLYMAAPRDELSSMSPTTADTFIFRLQTKNTHFQFQLAVSVDLNNTEGEVLHVTTISDNYPRGFTPFEDYTKIDRIIRPQIRVIWNKSTRATGALLQLGFECRNILEETMCIEDMSGHESVWKLVEEIKGVTQPADDMVSLPDGKSTWSDIRPESKQEAVLIPFTKGHLAWIGNVDLNRPVAGNQHRKITGDEILLHPNTDISRIRTLRLDIAELDGYTTVQDIQFNTGTDHPTGSVSFVHNNKPAYVIAEIYKEKNGEDDLENIVINLSYEVSAGLESNIISIKDMVVFVQ